MMPKHIFEKQSQDISTFTHFDVSKDWPVTTSPWKVVYSAPDQKVLDLRDQLVGHGHRRRHAEAAAPRVPARSGRAEPGPGHDLERVRHRHRHPADDVSDGIRAEPEGHHVERPASAVWLRGLVAALAVRQHPDRPDRRSGYPLGDQLVPRSRPDRRLRLERRREHRGPADPGRAVRHADLLRRLRRPAQAVQHARVQPGQGRRHHAEQGLHQGLRRHVGRS